jgi:hypothetical protein
MADDTARFASKAQEAAGSMLDAMQRLASVQTGMLQRLSEVQQGLLRQAAKAANEQLQLVGQVRDPREFASTQADLIKRHGQLYKDQLKEATQVFASAWEEFGTRLEQSATTVTHKAQSAASSNKSS